MLSAEGHYTDIINENDNTCGCSVCNKSCIYTPSIYKEAIHSLRTKISKIESDSIISQASLFCDTLSDGLTRFDINHKLPEMIAINEPDEFYLEWIFDYYRFGFVFLEDASESGWFVLIKQENDTYRHNTKFHGDYRKAVDCALLTIRSESGQ